MPSCPQPAPNKLFPQKFSCCPTRRWLGFSAMDLCCKKKLKNHSLDVVRLFHKNEIESFESAEC